MNWTQLLLDQLDFYWNVMLMPRLKGLTDEEYLWEPVEGCWSIRPKGDGTFDLDLVRPEPSPPPVTTIAWRMGHIGSGDLGIRASRHFDDGALTLETIAWPGTAEAGIAFLQRSYAAWREGVSRLDEAGLARPLGDKEHWPGAHRDPMAALVLHINREVFHHGGEIALLRDLYRASEGGRRWAAAGAATC